MTNFDYRRNQLVDRTLNNFNYRINQLVDMTLTNFNHRTNQVVDRTLTNFNYRINQLAETKVTTTPDSSKDSRSIRLASSTQLPCQICLCFMLFLLAIWQEIVFHVTLNQQTRSLKQNFSAAITPIDKRCVILINI